MSKTRKSSQIVTILWRADFTVIADAPVQIHAKSAQDLSRSTRPAKDIPVLFRDVNITEGKHIAIKLN